jgi:hypothetical protein
VIWNEVTAGDSHASIQRWAKRDLISGQLLAATPDISVIDAKTLHAALSDPAASNNCSDHKPAGIVTGDD